jgi:hypothetical protein
MHKDYFGDAKDLAKRLIFDVLRGANTQGSEDLVGKLFVFPMLSTEESRDEAFLASYGSLLGNDCELLVGTRLWGGSHANRDASLSAVNQRLSNSDQRHTVFLDPDTGIMEDDGSEAGRKRMKKRDAVCLLSGDWDRVVVIYDESFSRQPVQRDDDFELLRLEALKASISRKVTEIIQMAGEQEIGGFAYVGMALNLVFCSTKRAKARLASIRSRLRSFLGTAATRRLVPETETDSS